MVRQTDSGDSEHQKWRTEILGHVDRRMQDLASLMFVAGYTFDDCIAHLRFSLKNATEASTMSVAEVAVRLGRGSAWVYEMLKQQPLTNHCDRFLLDEQILDQVSAEGGQTSISKLAVLLGQHEHQIKPIIESLVRRGYLEEIPDSIPRSFKGCHRTMQITHEYPIDDYGRWVRLRRAESVAQSASETRCFTLKRALTAEGAHEFYSQMRDYSRQPAVELSLETLHQETKNRRSLPDRSTMGAIMVFSPARGNSGAIAHYRRCAENWNCREFEILPYRYSLDDIAIQDFQDVHLSDIKNRTSNLLNKYSAPECSDSNLYQFSLVWGLL